MSLELVRKQCNESSPAGTLVATDMERQEAWHAGRRWLALERCTHGRGNVGRRDDTERRIWIGTIRPRPDGPALEQPSQQLVETVGVLVSTDDVR